MQNWPYFGASNREFRRKGQQDSRLQLRSRIRQNVVLMEQNHGGKAITRLFFSVV